MSVYWVYFVDSLFVGVGAVGGVSGLGEVWVRNG